MWNDTGAPRREGMRRSIKSLAAAMSPSCVAAVSTAWNTASMLPAASVSKRARAALVSVMVSSSRDGAAGQSRLRPVTDAFGPDDLPLIEAFFHSALALHGLS